MAPKTPIRPRDEDFDVESPVRRKSAEELKTKLERRDQSNVVICAILLSAVVIAVLGILIFYAFKAHQRTVVGVVTATETEVDFMTQTEETTTTQIAITIEEKTRATVQETEETEAETEEVETEEEPQEASESVEETETPALTEVAEAAGEDREYGGAVYHIVNGEAMLIRCYSTDAVMWMPSAVYDARCVEIADGAFADCEHLTAIELPGSYRRIGAAAFSNCVNLETVVLPDSVTDIGEHAFLGDAAVTIVSSAGSYAKTYAETEGLSWNEGNMLTGY